MAIFAASGTPIVLVEVVGYELYRRREREVPRPVFYVPPGSPSLSPKVSGSQVGGNSFVQIHPFKPEMKLVRDEELSHAVDQDFLEQMMGENNSIEHLYDRHGLVKDAVIRFYLTLASAGSIRKMELILLEMKAALRALRGPYPDYSLSAVEEMIQSMQGKNCAAYIKIVGMAFPEDPTFLAHMVAAAGLSGIVKDAPDLRQRRVDAVGQLWAQTFREEEPIDLPLERIYPSADGDMEAQLDRLAASAGPGIPAGAEEKVREFESLDLFMNRYAETLAKRRLTGWIDALKERNLPTKVWVIPAVAAVDQRQVTAYVTSEAPEEQPEWELAAAERLNREKDRLKETFFDVKRLARDSKFEKTSVVIRQTGGLKPLGSHPPVITLSILSDMEELRPSWVYAVAANEALWGKEIGPVLGVLTFQDETGQWVHAIFA